MSALNATTNHSTGASESAVAAPESLALRRLAYWEKTAPDRTAFIQPRGGGAVDEYTWREVLDQARRMATYLQRLGIGPGDRVAILAKNTAHWLMSDYAIWLAGGVSVPLYPTLSSRTVRQILEHSGARLLFVGKLDGWQGIKAGIPADLPCVSHPLAPADAREAYPRWDDIVARSLPLQAVPERGADELATIMYTSGTTGEPKGVMHSFGAFALAVEAGLRRIPMGPDSRMLSYLPLAHVVERALVEHGQLATGMQVYFAESASTFTQDLQRARPTSFFSVPRLWLKFQQGINANLPQKQLDLLLRIPVLSGIVKRRILTALGLQQCTFAACGAAPMPVALLRFYARLGLRVFEGYGMTENIGSTHLTTGDDADIGTVGRPYAGVQCRIDPATGEVQVRCAWLMQGYYREPALTRDAFTADGWLRTGDQGAIDAAGRLTITGRVKDLFKTSKGKYVAPAPIEDRLVMHAAVEACCVTGANLRQPLALLVLNLEATAMAASPEGRGELEHSLARHMAAVNETLDPHEQLECLVVTREAWTTGNDLITPTLKVKRNKIEDRFAARYEQWVGMRKKVIWTE